VANGATERVADAEETVRALGSATRRVESLVELIRAIAGQTHLLALNATIEAARAGEAGRSFSVVADEVKSLASQTAHATKTATSSVAAIEAGSGHAGRVIGGIAGTIERVSESQTAIAAAVEQQTATTKDIGRAAAEAAFGSSFIADNITMLAEGARAAAYSGVRCRTTANDLAEVTRDLEALLEGCRWVATGPSDVQVDSAPARAVSADGVTTVVHHLRGTGINEFDYRGDWCHTPASRDDAGAACSSMPNDAMALRFFGTQVTLYGVNDANFGRAAVCVDDGEETEVDLYATLRENAAVMWSSPELPLAEHTLHLRVIGTKSQASRYFWVGVERAEIRQPSRTSNP
jgi:hypothetical protein